LPAIGAKRAEQLVRKATKSSERLRILLAGESTTGKTTSFLTLPNALKACGVENPKIVVADFDQNGDELLDHPNFDVYRFGGIPGSDPEAFGAARWWLENEAKKMSGVHVFVTDSITALSLTSLAAVAKDNNRLGQAPQLQDWNHEMHATQQWCLDMQNLPVSHAIITTVHTHLEKDDLSGRAFNRLVLTGKLPEKLVRLFPEIYYAHVVSSRAAPNKYNWRLVPDAQTKARTMIKGLRGKDGIVEQDFTPMFREWFAGRKEEDTSTPVPTP
jgi:hypothetical protein